MSDWVMRDWLAAVEVTHISHTLLHFLWQGFAVAGAVACALNLAGRAAPAVRYAMGLCGLMLMASLPVATFFYLQRGAVTPIDFDFATSYAANPTHADGPLTVELASSVPDKPRLDWYHFAERIVVVVWLSGVCALGLRLSFGMVGLSPLRRSGQAASSSISSAVARLSERLGLRRTPNVYVSARIREAIALGFVRPIVLIPISWATEMTPEMVEGVLAHELAHIRRGDLWVNLLQRVLETLLFYHPAVWWVSGLIRSEREKCCDELAIAATNNRKLYAELLARLGEAQAERAPLLASFLGGRKMFLLDRVQHLLGAPNRQRIRWWPAGILALLVPLGIWHGAANLPLAAIAQDDAADDEQREPTNDKTAATELRKRRLATYIIEPPDILQIDAINLIPKQPYKLRKRDTLRIEVTGTIVGAEIVGQYKIDDRGKVPLGPSYGTLDLAGLTIDEATDRVRKHLEQTLTDPEVQLVLETVSNAESVSGQRLVGPDGTISLGTYGHIQVSGLELSSAQQAIEERLSAHFDDPNVAIDIFAFNSKAYYVVLASRRGDSVVRLPITGSETALDALTNVQVPNLSRRQSWIIRTQGDKSQKLAVDWKAILGGTTDTNYQLLPGDRLFFADEQVAGKTANRAMRSISEHDQRMLEALESLRDEVQQLRQEIKDAKPAAARPSRPTRLDR